MSVAANSNDNVYDRVRNAILDGELAPGAVMSQVGLADELGISRTPLREALRMLQSEGLIESEPNRRVRVAPMTPEDLEQLCIMRITLEAEALRLSIPRMTPEDLAGLEGYMAEMAHYAEAEDSARWVVPHRAFHRALTQGAGLLASHLARTGLEVTELLDPEYDPAELKLALIDVGGEIPTKRQGRRR